LISKLKAWKKIDKHTSDKWKSISELMSPYGSWRGIREAFKEASAPCCFPIEIFKRDIILINENEDFYDMGKNLINLLKRRLLTEVIYRIQKVKSRKYMFAEVKPLVLYLQNMRISNESELEEYIASLDQKLPDIHEGRPRSDSKLVKSRKDSVFKKTN